MSSAPAVSTIYVKVPVAATESGAVVDPTSGDVTMAFTAVGADAPAPGDSAWKAADWETDTTRDPDRYYARCLTGPDGGVITLTAASEYDVWVKIVGIAPEIVILRAGRHTAT